MRIQHNITAMNSYRNFTTNNSQLSKNLEKLSSGYKINRAGDDAAGLAISEKMRAQITGIEGATKNSKDGISLIQTAEGALTEVHSMLNRMTTLAEQSANGTYDNEVDRTQLQKEVESLKSEIDRIADSTNYNGIKLLDGSLSKDGATKSELTDIDVSKMGIDITANATDIAAVKGVYTANKITDLASANSLTAGDKLSMTFNYTDMDGNAQSKTVTLRVADDEKSFVLDDGTEDGVDLKTDGELTTAKQATAEEVSKAFAAALNKDSAIKEQLNITTTGTGANGQLTFTARVGGDEGASVQGFTLSKTDKAGTSTSVYNTSITPTPDTPLNANKAYDLSKATTWDGKDSTLEDSLFEVNGEKFLFLDKDTTLDDAMKEKLNEIGVGNNYVQTAAAGTIANGDVDAMASKIAAATGLQVEAGQVNSTTGKWEKGSTGTQIRFTIPEAQSKKVGAGGLTLQIGDTADDYNKMTVSVDDMHTKALGIDKVDISTQEGASEAMKKIKDAINQVSDTRGGLGALQNRLDHTINNLGVMRENIQNAESMIRDTDVAEEMMTYTKNNILNQSAQAMLAQANQLPQGVLQLLG